LTGEKNLKKFIALKRAPRGTSVATPAKGRRIRLTVARRIMADYMWAASGVARADIIRPVALRQLIAVRSQFRKPPSWTAIFAKAFAIVAVEIPELRRAYIKYPWPYLYEYAESTVNIASEREIMGDIGLLPIRFRQPEAFPLEVLSQMIHQAADTPIEQTRFYRTVIRTARLPLFIRRLVWTFTLNVPKARRYAFGTYAVSSVARWKTELGTTRSPVPCLLSYGPMDTDGNVDVRLNIDHRILDGGLAARVVSRLEEVLNSSILEELRELAKLESVGSERQSRSC